MKRKIIKIDEDKCNGCGLCVPNCAEGALQVINGKVKLVSEVYCDGLGACLGECPTGALTIIERDAEDFDQEAVAKNLGKKSKPEPEFHGHACPSARVLQFNDEIEDNLGSRQKSQLRQWPVQLNLLGPGMPFFEDADLLICADCVPLAEPNFHQDLLKGKAVMIGCPKLDDVQAYIEKLTDIFKEHKIKSITVAIMEVPCCQGLYQLTQEALEQAGKNIPLNKEIIKIRS